MRDKVLFLGIAMIATLATFPSFALSQAQTTPTRIPQQIVINGQMASGAYVAGPAGQLQSFTCPSPQQYTAADGNSQGWACYEQTTGVWLLNAVPPVPAPQAVPVAPSAPTPVPQTPSQPPFVVFPRQAPVVVYEPPPVVYQAPVYYPPPPAVIYAPPPPVVVAPAYPPSVILGRAAIDAAGRIASAVILNSHYPRYVTYNTYPIGRRGRR